MSKTALGYSAPSTNNEALANNATLDCLFRRHNEWLKGWLSRQRWIVHSSEDIAAEVFLTLAGMKDLSVLREPRAMMKTIAHRLIYDARRRDDLFRDYQSHLASMPEAVAISAEERLIIVQALTEIDIVLSTLSGKARKAFLMNRVDGLKYADIAQELDVSVSMVRKYVTKGYRAIYEAQIDEE